VGVSRLFLKYDRWQKLVLDVFVPTPIGTYYVLAPITAGL
jgi:hypothetical protein